MATLWRRTGQIVETKRTVSIPQHLQQSIYAFTEKRHFLHGLHVLNGRICCDQAQIDPQHREKSLRISNDLSKPGAWNTTFYTSSNAHPQNEITWTVRRSIRIQKDFID